MKMLPSESSCPNEETLAAFVEGRLSAADRARVVEHASRCEDCIAMIDAANETVHAEPEAVAGPEDVAGPQDVAAAAPRAAHGQRWLLAAAAVLVLGIPLSLFLLSRGGDPVQQLVHASPRLARPVEARLSGGFPWAPYRGPMRAGGAGADREQMKLMGAVAEMLDRAETDRSAEVHHAAAVAMVLVDRAEEGGVRLAAEARRTPDDARAWSDLAAAQYAAAMAGRTALYPEALASADRALRIDPRLAEALFNRALVLERLGLHGQARAAWQRYLEADPSSPWADEAREHLSRLAATGELRPFDADREPLERAAAAGDEAVVRSLVARHAERARAFGEVEYLGRWAEGLQRGDAAEAGRWLTVARNIGAALAATSGEALLRDAVAAVAGADPTRRARIAEAHHVYRRGRVAFSRQELSTGERDLRDAARQFAAAGDPMALAARSYAAGARLAQNDVVTARRELSALVAEVDSARGYLSLGGQVRWELARALRFDGDSAEAARVLGEAAALFRKAGEPVNEAMIGTMLAHALIAAGRPDEGWRAHSRAFAALTAAQRIDFLDAAVSGAAATALRSGQRETARSLTGISESLQRGMSSDLLLADTLVRKSLLAAPDDPEAAVAAAREAAGVAARLPDPAHRSRHLADADLAMAVALAGADPRRAHDLATRALDLYSRTGMTGFLAEPYLIRARAALRLGDAAAAERDLEAGMLAVERHPATVAGAVIGTGVLDAGNALFEESIRLDLDRGRIAAALATAERMRGIAAGAAEVDALRRRLRDSGTAVAEVVVLPGEIVTFIVTEAQVSAVRKAIAREETVALAAAGDDAALFDLVIRPSLPALARARALIVVADAALEGVPFSALRDRETGRALVERMPVALARSAVQLELQQTEDAPSTLAAIALPSNARDGRAALPEVDVELSEIGRLYRSVHRTSGTAVTPRLVEESTGAADVLHIAGHTGVDAAGNESLAAGALVSWRSIAAMREMPPVVVLSACNTLRGPRGSDRRALSLAGAFAAAGARDVIGTLEPIGDRDARSLFLALHEELARGVAAPDALRSVQLARLRQPNGAWRRLAVLTTRIHHRN